MVSVDFFFSICMTKDQSELNNSVSQSNFNFLLPNLHLIFFSIQIGHLYMYIYSISTFSFKSKSLTLLAYAASLLYFLLFLHTQFRESSKFWILIPCVQLLTWNKLELPNPVRFYSFWDLSGRILLLDNQSYIANVVKVCWCRQCMFFCRTWSSTKALHLILLTVPIAI